MAEHGSRIVESVEHDEDCAPAESEEHVRVRAWRYEQFVTLGFDPLASARLALAAVDLNGARRLIALGCPVATAAEILL